jgi:hypothetical protein
MNEVGEGVGGFREGGMKEELPLAFEKQAKIIVGESLIGGGVYGMNK